MGKMRMKIPRQNCNAILCSNNCERHWIDKDRRLIQLSTCTLHGKEVETDMGTNSDIKTDKSRNKYKLIFNNNSKACRWKYQDKSVTQSFTCTTSLAKLSEVKAKADRSRKQFKQTLYAVTTGKDKDGKDRWLTQTVRLPRLLNFSILKQCTTLK